MNGQMRELEAWILEAWKQVEISANGKDRVATQNALDTVTHLEQLKEQQEALDKKILASISAKSVTEIHPATATEQPDALIPLGRRKRPTNRPREIRIGAQRETIRYAYEILLTVANWIIEQGKMLPTIPNFIQSTKKGFAASAGPKLLKSGQFIEVGDDQKVLLYKARTILDYCGFQSVKFKVEFADGSELER